MTIVTKLYLENNASIIKEGYAQGRIFIDCNEVLTLDKTEDTIIMVPVMGADLALFTKRIGRSIDDLDI